MYLREQGLDVTSVDDPDRAAYRAEVGIADEYASCHTAKVGDYVIEGHVPVEAIERLIAERPDAIGLALPGMPADSPGMGGDASTWANQPVLLIARDGSASAWAY